MQSHRLKRLVQYAVGSDSDIWNTDELNGLVAEASAEIETGCSPITAEALKDAGYVADTSRYGRGTTPEYVKDVDLNRQIVVGGWALGTDDLKVRVYQCGRRVDMWGINTMQGVLALEHMLVGTP